MLFKTHPTGSLCGKNIEGNELVYVQMRYPKRRGMTEIRVYLK
jgi:hypothetical protein